MIIVDTKDDFAWVEWEYLVCKKFGVTFISCERLLYTLPIIQTNDIRLPFITISLCFGYCHFIKGDGVEYWLSLYGDDCSYRWLFRVFCQFWILAFLFQDTNWILLPREQDGSATSASENLHEHEQCLLGRTQGSTLFACHAGAAPKLLLLMWVVQKTLFLVNSVYTNNVLNTRVHV